MKCPLCQNLKTNYLFKAKSTHGAQAVSEETFTFCQCTDCNSVFPKISISKDYYSKYYPGNYYHASTITGYLNSFYQKINLAYLKLIIGSFVKRGSVLDFGCGEGEFLLPLGNSFKKFGVEINSNARTVLKKKSPTLTVLKDIDGFEKKQRFDLITVFHVLEHLPDPITALKKIVARLKKGGYLFLATPNNNSLGFKIAKGKWFHLDAPRHLLIFNQEELERQLKKLGLKPVLVRGNLVEYPLDLFWSWFNWFKTRSLLINFPLTLLVLPLSLIVKLFLVFLPKKAETLMIVCRKN